jgi:HEPN domain-containing protein
MVEQDKLSEWMRIADMDLREANRMLSHWPVPIEIICNLCQQSTEKYLKAFLYSKGLSDPPHIHSLPTLREICADKDSKFNDADVIVACNALNPYSVHPKYPDEYEITEQQMQKALKYAEEIKNSAPIEKIREKIEYKEPNPANIDNRARLKMLTSLNKEMKKFGISVSYDAPEKIDKEKSANAEKSGIEKMLTAATKTLAEKTADKTDALKDKSPKAPER